MFTPKSFAVNDDATLYEFISQHNFATFITIKAELPVITHVPLIVVRKENQIFLEGHMAQQNPHALLLDKTSISTAVFTGPHAYISHKSYRQQPSVPTWNYTAVHVQGPVSVMTPAELNDHLRRSLELYESEGDDIDVEYKNRLSQLIIGFKLEVKVIQGKFKLSQNKPEEEQRRVIDGLNKSGLIEDKVLKEFMEGRLRKAEKSE